MNQPAGKSTAAGAVGAKTARACDSCLTRRARWYCAADDAFLCQLCDNSVHSANPLARRHERVRLKSSSSSSSFEDDVEPSWHHGFRRKARTPRGGAKGSIAQKEDTIVPDLESPSFEEFVAVEEEQLLYCVPILDPLLSDFCSPRNSDGDEKEVQPRPEQSIQNLARFLIPSDIEIPEFDMDVETLLGRDLDEDAFSMEELGLAEAHDQCLPVVKKEEETDGRKGVLVSIIDRQLKVDVDVSEETIDVNFDCCTHSEEKPSGDDGWGKRKRMRIMLDLNYDGVICAWDKQACPWIDGRRPQLDLDDWSPGFAWGGVPRTSGHAAGDGEREARVSRYREKRRTRFFSKKIRYEVRKLNAEKRPRMKGRFVKRTSLLPNDSGGVGGGAATVQAQYVF